MEGSVEVNLWFGRDISPESILVPDNTCYLYTHVRTYFTGLLADAGMQTKEGVIPYGFGEKMVDILFKLYSLYPLTLITQRNATNQCSLRLVHSVRQPLSRESGKLYTQPNGVRRQHSSPSFTAGVVNNVLSIRPTSSTRP